MSQVLDPGHDITGKLRAFFPELSELLPVLMHTAREAISQSSSPLLEIFETDTAFLADSIESFEEDGGLKEHCVRWQAFEFCNINNCLLRQIEELPADKLREECRTKLITVREQIFDSLLEALNAFRPAIAAFERDVRATVPPADLENASYREALSCMVGQLFVFVYDDEYKDDEKLLDIIRKRLRETMPADNSEAQALFPMSEEEQTEHRIWEAVSSSMASQQAENTRLAIEGLVNMKEALSKVEPAQRRSHWAYSAFRYTLENVDGLDTPDELADTLHEVFLLFNTDASSGAAQLDRSNNLGIDYSKVLSQLVEKGCSRAREKVREILPLLGDRNDRSSLDYDLWMLRSLLDFCPPRSNEDVALAAELQEVQQRLIEMRAG